MVSSPILVLLLAGAISATPVVQDDWTDIVNAGAVVAGDVGKVALDLFKLYGDITGGKREVEDGWLDVAGDVVKIGDDVVHLIKDIKGKRGVGDDLAVVVEGLEAKAAQILADIEKFLEGAGNKREVQDGWLNIVGDVVNIGDDLVNLVKDIKGKRGVADELSVVVEDLEAKAAQILAGILNFFGGAATKREVQDGWTDVVGDLGHLALDVGHLIVDIKGGKRAARDGVTDFLQGLEDKAAQILAQIVKDIGGVAIDKKQETQDGWLNVAGDIVNIGGDLVNLVKDIKGKRGVADDLAVVVEGLEAKAAQIIADIEKLFGGAGNKREVQDGWTDVVGDLGHLAVDVGHLIVDIKGKRAARDGVTDFLQDLEAKAAQLLDDLVKAIGGVAIDKKRETQDGWTDVIVDGAALVQDGVKLYNDIKNLVSGGGK